MNDRIVYLMRGLPACGKSHMAHRLAGSTGVVLETDEYFYTQVGDDPTKYDFHEDLLPSAREWNFTRFQQEVTAGRTPIVVDRGSGLNAETRRYVVFAREHEYDVQLQEPDSPWWLELRILLKYKSFVSDELFDMWAEQLSNMTRTGHRVPAATIRHWMKAWKHDLTVDEIERS